MSKLSKVWRRGRFHVRYTLEDGTESGFFCEEVMTTFIINAWCKQNGFQDALAPAIILNKPCTVYDPIIEMDSLLGHEVTHMGRCKNCGAGELAHQPQLPS